jgi:hypothetical protein
MGAFSLPQSQTGRNLPPMVASDLNRQLAAATNAAAQPQLRPTPAFGGAASDTLHYSSNVAGSAAQFNCSVSAMPSYPSRTSGKPVHPGTADTLLLR